jgi:hypothetical protein
MLSPFLSRSIAFILYTLILAMINLYSTSGRNAAISTTTDDNIEMNPRTAISKWYTPVSSRDVDVDADAHIIGDDD